MAKEVILIDGANVAWEAPSSSAKKPRVSNIIAVKHAVEELGSAPIIIVDASLGEALDRGAPGQPGLVDRRPAAPASSAV